MSFLDAIHAKTVNNTEDNTPQPEKKVENNPLLKKNPLLPKKETPTSMPATKNPLLANKKSPNPFGPKTEAIKEEVVEDIKKEVKEVKEEVTEEAKKVINEVKKEITQEVTPDVTPEVVPDVTPDSEVNEEPKVEPSTEEPKKTSRKKGSRKKEETTEVTDNVESEETSVVIPKTSISYIDALEQVKSSFVDEKWDNLKVAVTEGLDSIVISEDMNPATLKQVTADLSKVRQMIQDQYDYYKTQYEFLASEKPEGLILRVRSIAYTKEDKNDMDRRKAGIMACMNYISPEKEMINLYELLDETRERYFFLKGKMDSIDYKAKALITMNGALKLDEKLM